MLQRNMSIEISPRSSLTDAELLLEVRTLAGMERQATARLIAVLGEVDARRLYLAEGCSSLFTYCTQVLHLSEHAAYGRIEAARAARTWPAVLQLLADGSVHLTAVTLLAPHLTAENHRDLLAAVRHKSKRDVEAIVAALRPRPPVASSFRKLPVPVSRPIVANVPIHAAVAEVSGENIEPHDRQMPSPPVEPSRRPIEIRPLAPEYYKVQFTVSRETHDKLRQAQDLLRHRVPNGDVAAIFDRALSLLLAELQRSKHAATTRPRLTETTGTQSRHVPAAVRRDVWDRDGGQCAFVGAVGRCSERGWLEYHHVVPFADGGATAADNLQLRCRAHNAYEAERWFGMAEEDLVRERREKFRERSRAVTVTT